MMRMPTESPRCESRSVVEPDELPLLTATEVARLLAVPKSTVYRLVRRRQLATVRLGRYFRFQRSAVRDCINKKEVSR
jgi:excisionase family DNA binding protein